MQKHFQFSDGISDWETGAEKRLAVSMLLATILVLLFLSLLRFPPSVEMRPFIELVVELVRNQLPAREEKPVAESPGLSTPGQQAELPPQSPVGESEPVVAPARDWAAIGDQFVEDSVAEQTTQYSINPAQDEKRQIAAEKFRPSAAPVKKPIWENVEKDVMGRTLLRYKNCYRVIDDPRVTNRWAFETFEQYITFCSGSGEEYLIEIDEIESRYAYLDEEAGKPGRPGSVTE